MVTRIEPTAIPAAPLVRTGQAVYRDAMASIRLGSIALDCADPGQLASFWADLLDGEVAFNSDAFAAVKTDSIWLAATRVDDYRPRGFTTSSRAIHRASRSSRTSLGSVHADSRVAARTTT